MVQDRRGPFVEIGLVYTLRELVEVFAPGSDIYAGHGDLLQLFEGDIVILAEERHIFVQGCGDFLTLADS